MQSQNFPVILDSSLLSSLGCVSRLALINAIPFVVLAFVSVLVFGAKQILADIDRRSGRVLPSPVEVLEPGVRKVLTVGAILIFALLLAVISTARTRTAFAATESSFVETGCRLGRVYEDVYDRANTKIAFRDRGGGKQPDELSFTQRGKRQLWLSLHGSRDFAALRMLAPDAMRDYAVALRERGETVPEAISDL